MEISRDIESAAARGLWLEELTAFDRAMEIANRKLTAESRIVKLEEYVEYLATMLDRSISYSDYLASQLQELADEAGAPEELQDAVASWNARVFNR